jgi:hypothetical protein
MIMKNSVEKAFDGNVGYDDPESFPPEYSVNVSVEFDSPVEAQKFVDEIETLFAQFRQRTALTKGKNVEERVEG